MSGAAKPAKVHILDKEYMVACADDERDALYASVDYLSVKMKEIRDNGKVVGVDRIAVMAALNMAHELLGYSGSQADEQESISKRIRALQEKIDMALNKDNQLEL